MISLRCGQCGKEIVVNDDLASTQVKCTGCGYPVADPQANVGTRIVEGGSPDAGDPTSIGADLDAGQAGLDKEPSPDLYAFLAPAQLPDEIGRLGPFRVLKVLGIGGMGVVYKAEDPQLKRPVALKAILPTMGANELARKRFLREAQAAAAVVHDHIVPILQVGEDRGVPFIAMQFLEGEPLNARLKREGRLPLNEVVRISREIAEGLSAAHEKGLIHRDIKPANIWLEGKKGRVKILDFGLARVAEDDAHISRTGAILGTPAYMAPEQAAGETVDLRCDLFSLGCVLYCMCTGQLPFKGKNTLAIISALAMTTPPSPRALQDDLPQPLSDLIMRLLAKKPEERLDSAQAVLQALQEIDTQPSVVGRARAQPAPQPVAEEGTMKLDAAEIRRVVAAPKRFPWPWVAGGVAVLLALFLVVRPWQTSPPDVSNPTNRPETGSVIFTNSLGMEFVLVGKGTAWLGGGGGMMGAKEVPIPDDFYLGKYEVTQEEWEKVTGLNPSFYKDVPGVSPEDMKRFPVEDVSWDDAQALLAKLNERDKQPGWVYRLPTEAEWEYACRGGPHSTKVDGAFDFYGATPANQLLPKQANCDAKRTCKVGSYLPNRLGLHDMHGNVWEWCADELPADPKDAKGAPLRAARGGSWPNPAGTCTATSRQVRASVYSDNNYGVRLARVPAGKNQ